MWLNTFILLEVKFKKNLDGNDANGEEVLLNTEDIKKVPWTLEPEDLGLNFRSIYLFPE